MAYTLRIVLYGKNVELDNVEEYVSGYRYFYCRLMDGETLVFPKNRIAEVLYRSKGRWRAVFLKSMTLPPMSGSSKSNIIVTTYKDGKPVDTVKQG